MLLTEVLILANQTAKEFRRKSWNSSMFCRLVDAGDDFIIMFRNKGSSQLYKMSFRFKDITATDYELVEHSHG